MATEKPGTEKPGTAKSGSQEPSKPKSRKAAAPRPGRTSSKSSRSTTPRKSAKSATPPKLRRPRPDTELEGFKPVLAEIVDTREDKVEPTPGPPLDAELDAEVEGQIEPEVEWTTPTEDAAESKALAPADPIARYLAEIGRYKLLTREQERELAIRYRETGDAAAAERLVTANLRFVVKIAAEYTKFGAKLIDLIQEGNVGLMHAVKEFNPYKGVRLITYAVWWIRGYIQEYLMRQYSMVRIGTTATQRKLFYQLQKEREQLERVGLEQGLAQLSGRLGVSADEAHEMHSRLTGRDVSLDQPVNDEGSARLLDLQSEADPLRLEEVLGTREELTLLSEKIAELRPSLNEREQFLLDHRLLADDPLTLQEIGDRYGTTREAVRQMENRLIAKIKKLVLSGDP
ncbi:MAG: RNA polymerase factor sigma-32 [Bdellovibrionales bacterium]